ncbi:MAG TPA: glycosyltransferase family 4 protein [Puia sp.]|nr:glycosyltransferase family 4 protein [Puia sp.]
MYFTKQIIKLIGFLSTRREIKVVHIHSSKQGSFYRKLIIACIAKLIFRKKTINHIHSGNFKRFYDSSNPVSKRLICFFLKLNDVTFTVSDSWKAYFETSFHLKNVHKINNIVIPHQQDSGICAGKKNGVVYFLFLGMIHPDKGIFDLLQVLKEHRIELLNRIKLFIGGSGQTGQLEKTIEAGDLGEMVEFKGWVTGSEKDNLLQFSDVFVLPSYYEGSPVAVLEAMSYGTPVISTTVGGIPEIVQQGFNGWLHRPGDQGALLKAIMYYINDPENIKMHGTRSMQMIEDYYPRSVEPQLSSVYSSLLS